MNKFLKMVLIGFGLTLLVGLAMTWVHWDSIVFESTSFALSFLASMFQDILFFGLVGLTVVVAQFYQNNGEILRKRVQNLFSNPNVSYAAISFIENQVRDSAIYCYEGITNLEVHEYDEVKGAYRVSFHNKYVLRNMFGDVPYEANISANVAPDLIRDDIETLGKVVSVRLTVMGDNPVEFLDEPKILGIDGYTLPVKLTLPKNGEAVYEMKWWSWVDDQGNSGFSMKRFAERYEVRLENKTSVHVGLSKGIDPEKIEYLDYGQDIVIGASENVPPNERIEFLWHPPKEYRDAVESRQRNTEIHPALTSHRKGEKN